MGRGAGTARAAHAPFVARRRCVRGGRRALRRGDGVRPLMAKRRGEPLVCHVPSKRLLREPPSPARAAAPERRPRGEAAAASPAAPKRKLEEVEAPPGKRPGLRGSSPRGEQGDAGGRRRRRGGPAVPQDEQTAEGRAGDRGKERAAVAEVTRRGWDGGRPPGRMPRWAGPGCSPPGSESRRRCWWQPKRYRGGAGVPGGLAGHAGRVRGPERMLCLPLLVGRGL